MTSPMCVCPNCERERGEEETIPVLRAKVADMYKRLATADAKLRVMQRDMDELGAALMRAREEVEQLKAKAA